MARPRPTTAVVLAAGRGERMRRPELPKPLVHVGGRPMLDRVLEGMEASGCKRCVLVVGFLRDLVEARYGRVFGAVAVEYAVQAEQRGTADAVLCAAPLLASETAVLLTWADILVAPAWYEMLATAWSVRPDLVALTTVVEGNPSLGALVEFDAGLRMTGITEKPAGVTRGWADGGVSVHSSESLRAMAGVTPSPRGELEVATAIGELVGAGRPVGVEKYVGPWCDLGTPELVAEAERRFPELLA